jgi:hypothetical protein
MSRLRLGPPVYHPGNSNPRQAQVQNGIHIAEDLQQR